MPAGLNVSRYQFVATVRGIAPAVATLCLTANSEGLAITIPFAFLAKNQFGKTMRHASIRRNFTTGEDCVPPPARRIAELREAQAIQCETACGRTYITDAGA